MGAESEIFRKVARTAAILKKERAAAKGLGTAAEDIAKIDESLAKAEEGRRLAGTQRIRGTDLPRVGISQRTADALKAETLQKSGEKGWQNLTGQFRARLEEGGEFPLRFSRETKPGGVGGIRSLGTDITGEEVTISRAAEQQLPRTQANVGRPYYPAKHPYDLPIDEDRFKQGVQSAVDRRAARGEMTVRESISGTPAAADQPIAGSAATQFARTGRPRGIRGIAQGVVSEGEQTGYQRLRRAVQSGVVRAVPAAAAGGYAAQGWGEIAGTYTGPDSSHRNPQVQWGRNRQ